MRKGALRSHSLRILVFRCRRANGWGLHDANGDYMSYRKQLDRVMEAYVITTSGVYFVATPLPPPKNPPAP